MNNLQTLTPTATKHIEPVEIPDKDPFGDPFKREYAPPAVKPGEVEPVIIPPLPAEEKPKESMATVTTQKEALAKVAAEMKEVEEEEKAAYQAYLKKYIL